MYKFRHLAFGALAALALVTSAHAAMPISGQAPGGGHPTIKTDKDGRLCDGMVFCDNTNDWTVTGINLANTTSTPFKAAGGATKRHCVTWVDVSPIATTVATQFTILDGVTVKFTHNILAGTQPPIFTFRTPICGTAATAINVKLGTTPTGAVDVSGGGYDLTN